MVDARLPSEWLGSIRIDNLSDRAFRVLAGALMWCNGQGTDGIVPLRYTKYLHPDGDDAAAFEELEQAGLWRRDDEGFTLVGWSENLRQSTAEEVQRYREASRRRQKAYRDRRRGIEVAETSEISRASSVSGDVTHNASRDVTADVGSGSLGSAATGKSAYVRRDVTHNADSPFCREHPTGTSEPCGACARARTAFTARQNTIPGLGWDCAVDGHKLVVDGTCAVCDYRPAPAA
ncbi:hypothetical protein ASD56_12490 [Microbacterium sp. Root166]|uniref:hypothetical protein n=1 Tax=Microbacterium sp. Root166 TaxID=1736478 RepID=UPI0006FE755F|nr:hypothetical protein [Microbacterium sp. Root166]KQZ83140.1 hypothetical protein ASD56_12490 [Microbacterium sp. Root166]